MVSQNTGATPMKKAKAMADTVAVANPGRIKKWIVQMKWNWEGLKENEKVQRIL